MFFCHDSQSLENIQCRILKLFWIGFFFSDFLYFLKLWEGFWIAFGLHSVCRMPISLECISIWKLNLKSTRVMFGWRKSRVANFRVVFGVKLSKHPLGIWSHLTVFLIGRAHVGGPQLRACCTSLCFLPTVFMFEVVSFAAL